MHPYWTKCGNGTVSAFYGLWALHFFFTQISCWKHLLLFVHFKGQRSWRELSLNMNNNHVTLNNVQSTSFKKCINLEVIFSSTSKHHGDISCSLMMMFIYETFPYDVRSFGFWPVSTICTWIALGQVMIVTSHPRALDWFMCSDSLANMYTVYLQCIVYYSVKYWHKTTKAIAD